MRLEEEIIVNKYAQGLISAESLSETFAQKDWAQKKSFLNDLLYLIMQSKPTKEDIEPAIKNSGLKPTFTPCILLQKGVANHQIKHIIELPEPELDKANILLLNLFKVAFKRRFDIEKNNPDKWWYWDLSDSEKVEMIINKYKY